MGKLINNLDMKFFYIEHVDVIDVMNYLCFCCFVYILSVSLFS